ncbi:MAG: molybdopterin molybdenumtransferase MoeA, partial [Candidatus Dadabacteria bacterium]|nr:molybdopterin molybdenumtransferase MoeA [Candidatus Dadabacteria bacterium]
MTDSVASLEPIYLNLEAALGHIIAEDISTPIDLPPFTSSAMD